MAKRGRPAKPKVTIGRRARGRPRVHVLAGFFDAFDFNRDVQDEMKKGKSLREAFRSLRQRIHADHLNAHSFGC